MNPDRIRAAIRLLYPDEMTPTAKRVLLRIIEEETHEAASDDAASYVLGDEVSAEEPWHAEDCSGTCDGCGHIAGDGFWYNVPCPDALLEFQQEWSE